MAVTKRGLVLLAGMATLALTFGSATAMASSATGAHPDTSSHPAERVCAQPGPGNASCLALKRTDVVQGQLAPLATPSGYGPADLVSAYKLGAGGAGQTVAIVDAYDDPNAESDLANYRSQYGLAPCTTANGCFKKVNQNGQTSPLPIADTGWAGEISLDVDMVSAICPSCNILLVEASTPSMANLGTSVNTAVSMGAKYVSNSYGGAEDASTNSNDTSYFNHPGVAITASTGDSGYGISYPASSKYVTAVGGTSLNRDSSARGWNETAWNKAGSGCSAYVAKPAFQSNVNTGCSNRANADVGAVADPATGVAVYQTYGGTGWAVYGGTSASSPIIAAVYALAGTPGATDTPNTYPYSHTTNLFDVTSGSNGVCSASVQCNAGPGWDGPTGLGTPNGTAAFTAAGGGGGTTCSAPGQKLANPGFESGNTGWTASTGVIGQNGPSQPAHTGTWNAWLDGYGTTHTDTVSQSVTIPAGCHATLSFWLHIDTAETSTVTAYDKLTVQLGTSTLATYSNLNAASGYVQKSFDVSSFAGQTVTLKFTGTEDASLQTSFVLDDTALNAS